MRLETLKHVLLTLGASTVALLIFTQTLSKTRLSSHRPHPYHRNQLTFFPNLAIFHPPIVPQPTLHHLRTHPKTHLLKQHQNPGSLGESIRIHTPFHLPPPHNPTSPAPQTLSCATFAHTPIPTPICKSYLTNQTFYNSGLHYTDIRRVAASAPAPTRCDDITALLLQTHARDVNVCHMWMRFLMPWSLLRRSHTDTPYANLTNIKLVVVLVPYAPLYERFRPLQRPARRDERFHPALLRLLFKGTGAHVVLVRSLSELRRSRGGTVCFRKGAVLGSHANRFFFPDAELGEGVGNDTMRSTDAYMFREGLWPGSVPRMRNSWYTSWRTWRTWTFEAERKFRALLKEVAEATGVEVVVLEGQGGTRGMPGFWGQMGVFRDASVVVGFHGAGLSHCVVAPEGASVVEIAAEDHRSGLFSNLRSSGLRHSFVYLSKGTRARLGRGNRLVDADLHALRTVLEERVRAGIELVAARGR